MNRDSHFYHDTSGNGKTLSIYKVLPFDLTISSAIAVLFLSLYIIFTPRIAYAKLAASRAIEESQINTKKPETINLKPKLPQK